LRPEYPDAGNATKKEFLSVFPVSAFLTKPKHVFLHYEEAECSHDNPNLRIVNTFPTNNHDFKPVARRRPRAAPKPETMNDDRNDFSDRSERGIPENLYDRLFLRGLGFAAISGENTIGPQAAWEDGLLEVGRRGKPSSQELMLVWSSSYVDRELLWDPGKAGFSARTRLSYRKKKKTVLRRPERMKHGPLKPELVDSFLENKKVKQVL
jgi:hypothetical protein